MKIQKSINQIMGKCLKRTWLILGIIKILYFSPLLEPMDEVSVLIDDFSNTSIDDDDDSTVQSKEAKENNTHDLFFR
jgi:hypothetical protein